MHKRASSISGELEIRSTLGEGTLLSVAAPLPPRVTLTSWPVFLWKSLREHTHNVKDSDKPDPHSYS